MDKTNSSKMTADGRLTVPVSVRRRHGIKPGTRVVFIEDGDRLIFQPVTREYISSFCGKFKRKPDEKPFAEWWAEHKREEMELEERKFQRLK